MFIRASSLILPVVALSSVVSAAPASLSTRDSCSGGTVQCCNTVFSSSSSSASFLAGLLGITDALLGPLMGVNCSPIGGVGANCVQQTVCCQNVQFNGLINIGCIAININL
ncbi:hypothetical protein SCLCIDRAFT_875079 [Scleroderma citrinum Foug A]|uniref:Hydrophobin n=1 Tax=Scleroderma citrinum Foug A TaxID=1036808 RepID=A0A0C3E078_9AGAM|nr:hypothetical protein SCLCIDRAFT_875079 [Scleroderma citrinum Foug A]